MATLKPRSSTWYVKSSQGRGDCGAFSPAFWELRACFAVSLAMIETKD
jgi:hypothetical protein